MLDRKDIEKLAELSVLDVTQEEAESLREQIDSILGYVSELQKVAATERKPVVGEYHTIMREDTNPHEGGIHTDAILREAPKKRDGYVEVKKILG